MPMLEELLPTLTKARVFTVLDAKNGFNQVNKFLLDYLLDPLWPLSISAYAIWYIVCSRRISKKNAYNIARSYWFLAAMSQMKSANVIMMPI